MKIIGNNLSAQKKIKLGLIAPLCFISFVCLACLASVLYVSQTNSNLQQKNHWQELAIEEIQYHDIKKLVAAKQLSAASETVKARARALASIYRQDGKQEESATIYRMLGLSHSTPSMFISDVRELASLYTDMGASKSAIETYQKILEYDKARLPAQDPAIGCDVNNLGQCYYTTACRTAEPALRKNYLLSARDQFEQAEKLTEKVNATPKNKSDQSIIKRNKVLLEMDLPRETSR